MAYNRKPYNRSGYNALAGVITLISFSYVGTSTQPSIPVTQTSFPSFTQNGSLGVTLGTLQTDYIFGGYSGTSSAGVGTLQTDYPTLAYAGTSTQPSIAVLRSAGAPDNVVSAVLQSPSAIVVLPNVVPVVLVAHPVALATLSNPGLTVQLNTNIINIGLSQPVATVVL